MDIIEVGVEGNARCVRCCGWLEDPPLRKCPVCGWEQSEAIESPSNTVPGIEGHVIRDRFPICEMLDNVFHGRPVLISDDPKWEGVAGEPPDYAKGKTGKLLWTGMGPFGARDFWATVELDEPIYLEMEGPCSQCQRDFDGGRWREVRWRSCFSECVEPLDGEKDW